MDAMTMGFETDDPRSRGWLYITVARLGGRKHRVTIENVHELARALGMPMDHHGQRGREIGG